MFKSHSQMRSFRLKCPRCWKWSPLCATYKMLLVINFGQKEDSILKGTVLCHWKWSNNSFWTTTVGIWSGDLMTFQFLQTLRFPCSIKMESVGCKGLNGWYTLKQYWKRDAKWNLFKFLKYLFLENIYIRLFEIWY